MTHAPGTAPDPQQAAVERWRTLPDPKLFHVDVLMQGELIAQLTQEEYSRLRPKLRLVEEVAAKLAANMLKGTLKYDTDDYEIEKWLEMGIDDTADGLNYQMLLRDKMRRTAARNQAQAAAAKEGER